MTPASFPEQTTIFGEGQEQYAPLPAFVDPQGSGYVVTCWEATPEELAIILRTGKIWLTQGAFGHPLQPVRLTALSPIGPINDLPDITPPPVDRN